MSEQAVESCELGLSVRSAAHAAKVGDCEEVLVARDETTNPQISYTTIVDLI